MSASLREGHRAGQEVGAGTAKPGGTTAVSMGIENGRVGTPKVSGSERCPTEGAERPEWGSGPAARSSRQSLGRCWRSAVHSVRQGTDRFGEFLLPTHAVAVASDVDEVARVERRSGRPAARTVRQGIEHPPETFPLVMLLVRYPPFLELSGAGCVFSVPSLPRYSPMAFRDDLALSEGCPSPSVNAPDFHPDRGTNRSTGCPVLDFLRGRRPPVPRNLVRCKTTGCRSCGLKQERRATGQSASR